MKTLLLLLVAATLGQADAAREAHLKLLGEAVKDFCFDNEGRLPEKLADLVRDGYLDTVPTGFVVAAKRWNERDRVALVAEKDMQFAFFSDGSISKAGPPPARPMPALGMTLRDTKRGVEIVTVESAMLKEVGLRAGDRIAMVVVMDEESAETPVGSVKALHDLVRRFAGKELLLVVQRGEEEILVSLGEDAPSEGEEEASLESCLAWLARGDAEERAAALAELGTFGSAALPALPQMVKALTDQAEEVRAAAASAIGGIGAEPGVVKAIPALTRTIRDPVADVRLEAALTLREIAGIARGEQRMQALAALHEAALRDKDPRVRKAATVD